MRALHRKQAVVGIGPPPPEDLAFPLRTDAPSLLHSHLTLGCLPRFLGLGNLGHRDAHARAGRHDLTTSLHQLSSDSRLGLRSSAAY